MVLLFSSPLFRLEHKWWWGGVLVFVLSNIAGWLIVGIHPDEAYYWVWSERLQWGYLDHPPMVAWAIRLFTSIFGDSGAVIRMPSVSAWWIAMLVVYLIARDYYRAHSSAGVLAVLVFASAPIFQIGFHTVTPDAPLLLFTALAYYFVYRAVVYKHPYLWLAAGIATGLALLSKYTAVLLPLAIFLALIFNDDGRQKLKTLWPWVAMAMAIIIFLPVVVWNYNHDWISFRFQLGHGIRYERGISVINPLIFLVTQLAMVMPWTFIAMIVATWRTSITDRPDSKFGDKLLQMGFIVPLIFFLLTSLSFVGGANWPAMAYIPGSILLGGALSQWLYDSDSKKVRSGWVALIMLTCVTSLFLSTILRYPLGAIQQGLGWVPRNTQVTHTYGWDRLGRAVDKVYETQKSDGDCRILVDYHLLAAEIALQLNAVEHISVERRSRITQQTLWQDEGRSNQHLPVCVYVRELMSAPGTANSINISGLGKMHRVSVIELEAPERPRWYEIYIRQSQAGRYSR